ncbi:hypothetical protein KI387_025750, partial [Taxus chinensis]
MTVEQAAVSARIREIVAPFQKVNCENPVVGSLKANHSSGNFNEGKNCDRSHLPLEGAEHKDLHSLNHSNSNTVEGGSKGKSVLEISRLDHILVLLLNDFGGDLGAMVGSTSILMDNLKNLMIFTTDLAVLVACVFFFVWRRGRSDTKNPAVQAMPLVKEEDDEDKKEKSKRFARDRDN